MKRTFLVAALAAIAFSATIDSAQASRVYLGSSTAAYGSEVKGAAALLQLRIPFGGRDRERTQPRVTLAAGPMWQETPQTLVPGRYYFISSAEMGFSLGGDPVLRVGGIDLSEKIIIRLRAPGRDAAASY
jgi:hypothetical protein